MITRWFVEPRLRRDYVGSTETIVTLTASASSGAITLKGYADDEATKLVVEQSFDYKVDLLQTVAQMAKADVNDEFKALKRVNFSSSNGLAANLVDTVSYTAYSGKILH
jgi:hypothetical protein